MVEAFRELGQAAQERGIRVCFVFLPSALLKAGERG